MGHQFHESVIKSSEEYKEAMCKLNANLTATFPHNAFNHCMVSYFISRGYKVSINTDDSYSIKPKKPRGSYGKMA